MARYDIWLDGVETQFSHTNQPANRGRKKGRLNRATVFKAIMVWLGEHEQAVNTLRRDKRNALRRERYRLRKSM